MLSRRTFLAQSATIGLSSGLFSLGARAPELLARAAAAAEPRSDATILVVVELTGGNDGLNTVIPHADDIYHKSRPTLRIEPVNVLKLNDRVGLHPSLKELHALHEAGDLAVIQGVGYPNPNRSHTRSMEIWQTGTVGPAPPVGWLGHSADLADALRACHVGQEPVPLALWGRRIVPQALASPADCLLADGALLPETLAAGVDRSGDSLLDQVRRQCAAARELSNRLAAMHISPATVESGPAAGSLEGRLATIHTLIKADLPLRVYYTSCSGFDTHAGQRFTHQELLRQVSQGVAGFLKALKASTLADRVLVLLFSEFGRRLKENANGGTDHGAAAPVFVAGAPATGSLIGPPPNLSDLDDAGDPRYTTDFRDVYATLLRRWLGVDPEPILGKRDTSLAFV